MVCLMSESETPNACAFSWSTSSLNCAVSSRPLGRTLTKLAGCCAAMPSNWLRAWVRASWPSPAWSINSKSKPVAVPSSTMAGILNGMTKPSRILPNSILARWITASALFSSPLRSSHGFRLTKAIPAFCAWPLKLKPLTVKTLSTFAFSFFR